MIYPKVFRYATVLYPGRVALTFCSQDEVIGPYIRGITPMLRRFSRSTRYKLPSYKPRKSDPYATFIRGLKIPVRHGAPDFLLHDLGDNPEMEEFIRAVLDSPDTPQLK